MEELSNKCKKEVSTKSVVREYDVRGALYVGREVTMGMERWAAWLSRRDC